MLLEGLELVLRAPTAPSCDSRPRYPCKCGLSLLKPLEDVLFIIQYDCAATMELQGPPTIANPVTAQMYRVLLQNETPLPKLGFIWPTIENMSQHFIEM